MNDEERPLCWVKVLWLSIVTCKYVFYGLIILNYANLVDFDSLKSFVGHKCDMIKLINGKVLDEDIEFRMLEYETTITELELFRDFQEQMIKKLQTKKETLEEDVHELKKVVCQLGLQAMKPYTNEKNLLLVPFVSWIAFVVVYAHK